MMRYSAGSLIRNAVTGHKHWPPVWREPEPKPAYDIVIIGGGGHGLATAHYLARNHGLTNVAVLEKSYLGNGNIGRNTTIVRSNYLCPENIAFNEHSLKLWECNIVDITMVFLIARSGRYSTISSNTATSIRLHSAHSHGSTSDSPRRFSLTQQMTTRSGYTTTS